MKQDVKKAGFNRISIGFWGAIASATALLAILTSNISDFELRTNRVLANPTLDHALPTASSAIALKIDNLKQSDKRWIEIDLSEQHLFAWDGKNQAFTAVISTGKAKTPTYPGIYTVQRKYPLDRMRGANYDIANVPNVLYFDRGYALHGANWHNNFGMPMSHGCINLPVGNAQWLFDWAEIGTPVIIHQ